MGSVAVRSSAGGGMTWLVGAGGESPSVDDWRLPRRARRASMSSVAMDRRNDACSRSAASSRVVAEPGRLPPAGGDGGGSDIVGHWGLVRTALKPQRRKPDELPSRIDANQHSSFLENTNDTGVSRLRLSTSTRHCKGKGSRLDCIFLFQTSRAFWTHVQFSPPILGFGVLFVTHSVHFLRCSARGAPAVGECAQLTGVRYVRGGTRAESARRGFRRP